MAHSGQERATVFQITDVGLEAASTPGTLVEALTRFAQSSVTLDPNINFTRLQNMGIRFPRGSVAGKKWTSGKAVGNPTYDEMAWWLNGLADAATPSTPGGGTNTRDRTYTQSVDRENAPSTYTMKQGDKLTRAQRSLGVFVAGLGVTWDTDKIEQSIDLIGRKFEDGIQLSTNEVQSIIKSGTVTGGTFTLTLVNPQTSVSGTTGAIAYNASASTIQTALEALTTVITPGEVVCAGGPAPSVAVTFEFRGRFGQINVAAMTVDNTSITGGGTMALTTPTPGATPTTTTGVVMRPEHIKIYIDSTSGALGTTLIDRCYAGSFELRNVRGPHFVVDATQAGGMIGAVPLGIQGKLTLSLQADANNMAVYYAAADGSNATYFARIKIGGSAVGPLIEGTLYYEWTTDMAIQVAKVSPFKDNGGGIYAIDFDWDIINDGTWGKAWTSLLRNAVSAVA